MVTEKRCSKCKKVKPASCYSPDKRNTATGLQSQCKDCKRAYEQANKDEIAARTKAKRLANHDEYKAKGREYYYANLDTNRARARGYAAKRRALGKVDKAKKNEQSRIYRAKNREIDREKSRLYRLNNPEKRKQTTANYRAAKHAALIEKHREYNRKNRHITIAAKARRRAIERNAPGKFTAKEWRDLCARLGNVCLCCGKHVKLTPDHIVPLSKGGANSIDNIQPLCLPCNLSKGVKVINYREGRDHVAW